MVCGRCIRVVREELLNLGLQVGNVQLGTAVIETAGGISNADIAAVLSASGFELLEDRKARLVERIKSTIIDLVQNDRLAELEGNISGHLARELHQSYSSLSHLFSAVEGLTIERFVILQKIERAKELIVYDLQNLSEIAYRLGYSSVQHLSSQFKRVTGLTPSHFRELGSQRRRSIDQVAR